MKNKKLKDINDWWITCLDTFIVGIGINVMGAIEEITNDNFVSDEYTDKMVGVGI